MNVNIINGLVKGISEQIPLVNSFYTQSPYECWNVKEVQYGSVSFVITKVNTTDTVTTYEAVLYYADRLMEDGLNRDAIHSDAATVMQTIVGAMNQSDEYFRIEYPVGITLFEQDFSDTLAGGYANITIEVEGMGECFDGEFEIPEIVGTSAYYSKDEMNELFPMRTDLARVSFTGDFNDLKNTPDLLTTQEYNDIVETIRSLNERIDGCVDEVEYNNVLNRLENLGVQLSAKADMRSLEQFVEGQNTINVNFATELRNKVGSKYFEEIVSGINNELDNKVSRQDYSTLVENVSKGLESLSQGVSDCVKTDEYITFVDDVNVTISNKADKTSLEVIKDKVNTVENVLDTKLDKTTLETVNDRIETLEDTKADQRSLEQFVEGQNLVNVNLAVQLEKKVDDDYFDGWKYTLESKLDEKLDKQSFNNKMTNIYTKKEIDLVVETQLDKVFKSYVDSDEFIEDLEGSITDNVDRVIENYVEGEEFRVNLESVVENEVNSQIGEYVTLDELVEEVDSQLTQYIESGELDEEVGTIVNSKMNDFYKKTDVYTKTETDRKLNDKANVGDLSVYATKTELYNDYYNREQVKKLIEDADFTVEVDLKNYYQKAETYNKDEIDLKLKNVVVDVDMTDYYTKNEVDNKVNMIDGRLNGLQTQIDNIEVGTGGGGEVSKAEFDDLYESVLTSTGFLTEQIGELNTKIGNIGGGGVSPDIDLSDYMTESEIRKEFYTKTEVDNKLRNIDVDMTDYYTKTEIQNTYLTKSSANATYAKKSDTYTKTEVDTRISNSKPDLSGYCTKTEVSTTYATKTELQSSEDTLNGRISGLQTQIGNIDTILNKVLYEK